MKVISIIVFLLLVATLGAGCANSTAEPESTPSPEAPVFVHVQEPDEDESDDAEVSVEEKNLTLFDFSELPEEDFPRGMWTVNQLAEKYGPYESIDSSYERYIEFQYPEFTGFVFIKVIFKDVHVIFAAKEAKGFSFCREPLDPITENFSEKCVLSEADKDIELEILTLTFYSELLEFPYGNKIGKSTKSDIIASYPEGSVFQERVVQSDYYENIVIFEYGFRDENGSLPEWSPQEFGWIAYYFDETDVLQSVYLGWRWFSF